MHPQIRLILGQMNKNAETLKELNGGRRPCCDEETVEVLNKLIEINGELPPEFREQYKSLNEQIYKRLPFMNSKIEWRERYSDFKRISDVMETFRTNDLLREFSQGYPSQSNNSKAVEIYKKCISYRVKITEKIIKNLKFHPDTSAVHYCRVEYCIDSNKVNSFLKRYQSWMWCEGPRPLWNEVFNLREDFIFNSGYDRISWQTRIAYPDLLKRKAEEVEKLQEKLLRLLNAEAELLRELDQEISLEYDTKPFKMSLYEREQEIARMREYDDSRDDEYCYVYTLECELFVFYVGIAADPKERFEQHIRGAFSDEAHLFKSKFIQKYHMEVKHNIIFQGIRRDCKKFEKDYITEFRPLGNMTDGGEG
jgi:predicted GIY-YIG superfamily endonuclease